MCAARARADGLIIWAYFGRLLHDRARLVSLHVANRLTPGSPYISCTLPEPLRHPPPATGLVCCAVWMASAATTLPGKTLGAWLVSLGWPMLLCTCSFLAYMCCLASCRVLCACCSPTAGSFHTCLHPSALAPAPVMQPVTAFVTIGLEVSYLAALSSSQFASCLT